MKQIEIKYNTPADEWVNEIEQTLIKNDIEDHRQIAILIYKYLFKAVHKFLIERNYKPKETLYYRKYLVGKLERNNLDLKIISNKRLWKLLEYFKDAEDYTNCFDIDIILLNEEEAMKDIIMVINKIRSEPKTEKQQDLLERVAEIRRRNSYQVTKENHIDDILDLLEDIIEGGIR